MFTFSCINFVLGFTSGCNIQNFSLAISIGYILNIILMLNALNNSKIVPNIKFLLYF